MARAARGGPAAPPKAGPSPFPFTVILDEAGSFLCGFDGSMKPLMVSQLPPPLFGDARLMVSEGLLPPRSSMLRPGQMGPVLAVAGDTTYLFAGPAHGADEQAFRRAFAADLAFEAAFKAHLAPFDGNRAVFASAPGVLLRAFSGGAKAPAPPRPALFVDSTVDPSAPGVFVTLRIRNASTEPIRDVALRLASHRDYLRPSALYGDAATLHGSVIRLQEPVRPGVKRLELRLEPQEPLSAPLNIELVHLASRGERRSTMARPLRLSVAFPGIAPPRVVRPQEIRAFLGSHPLARDVWRVPFPKSVTPAFAFERAKEAVARERPAALLDYVSKDASFFESWHIGQIKGTERYVVVETAVRAAVRLIEFRVATERPADLLGIKAEYRRRVHQLLSERFMGKREKGLPSDAQAPGDARDVPQLHSTLLIRHLQGELAAADLQFELQRTASAGGGEGWELVSGIFAEIGAAGTEARTSPRPPQLSAHMSSADFDSQILDGFTRYLAPIVLVQTAHMARVGPRRYRGLDRAAETEIADFEGQD